MAKYPWQTIDPKDSIQIESHQNLTMQDVRILTKLYKPIIGGEAYAFYQSLFSELDFRMSTKNTSVSKLLTKMDLGIPDYHHARIRLEGIGLIQTYRSKEKEGHYIYTLNPPLSSNDFLKDSLLCTLLIEKIGKTLFQEEIGDLINELEAKEEYTDMTRSFVDVFHFDLANKEISNADELVPKNSIKKPKVAPTIKNVESFDYPFFKEGLNKHFIRQDSLTDDIKELIYTYHVIYGIDELTMQAIILESADVDSGEINKNKLTNTVQRMYLRQPQNRRSSKLKNKQEQINQATPEDSKETEESISKEEFTTPELTVINHAKKTSPGNFMKSIKEQKNGFVTTNEAWVLKELVEKSPLSNEVINILLHYILVIQGAVILEKNYAMKIANDWAQTNVQTAEDAVVKLRNIFNERKKAPGEKQSRSSNTQYKSRYRKNRKKETLPEWAKVDSPLEDDRLSASDEDELKNRLARIRKQRELKEDS